MSKLLGYLRDPDPIRIHLPGGTIVYTHYEVKRGLFGKVKLRRAIDTNLSPREFFSDDQDFFPVETHEKKAPNIGAVYKYLEEHDSDA